MDQLEKSQRYTLIRLNSSFDSLSKVEEKILHSPSYKEPFKAKGIEYDPTNDEYNFFYNWENRSSIEQVMLEDRQVNYLDAWAKCEFSKRKIRDSEKKILPKEDRLNIQETEVIFVEVESRVYAILMTFDSYELKRVKKLINLNNIEPLDSKYQIIPAIFTWLFYKYIMEKENINENLYIEGINGFTGNVLTDENKFSGDSGNTPDLIITKAFLANNYDITSIKLDLSIDDSRLTSFFINETNTDNELRVMALKNSTTTIILDSQDIHILMPIYIFFDLIPQIFTAYTNAKVEFESKEKNYFLANLAIEVVKLIMARNNLEIKDIYPTEKD